MTNFKKMYAATVGLLMIAAAQVHGYYNDSSTEYNNGLDYGYQSNYETESDCCQPQCCCINRDGESRWFIEAEALAFKSSLCGLESVFGNTALDITTDGTTVTTTATETHREPRFRWNAGYRIGAGYITGCENYDVQLYWTHFQNHPEKRRCNRGDWRLKYDVVDLTFGRRFSSGCWEFRPYIGVRFARIDQRLRARLRSTVTTGGIVSLGSSRLNHRERFYGVAPEIGIDAMWKLCGCWSVYGDFALATYYGHVRGRGSDTDAFTGTVTNRNFRSRRCFNSIETDAKVGVAWDTRFDSCGCNDLTFMLKVGLEQHRIYDFSDFGSDGTLSLSGFAVSGVLGF